MEKESSLILKNKAHFFDRIRNYVNQSRYIREKNIFKTILIL